MARHLTLVSPDQGDSLIPRLDELADRIERGDSVPRSWADDVRFAIQTIRDQQSELDLVECEAIMDALPPGWGGDAA